MNIVYALLYSKLVGVQLKVAEEYFESRQDIYQVDDSQLELPEVLPIGTGTKKWTKQKKAT